MTMASKSSTTKKLTRSQEAFVAAPRELQDLMKSVLAEEREVMHLRRRADIHQSILEHVKRIIR